MTKKEIKVILLATLIGLVSGGLIGYGISTHNAFIEGVTLGLEFCTGGESTFYDHVLYSCGYDLNL